MGTSDETAGHVPEPRRFARRTAVKAAGFGAGVLWVAPTVLTVTAEPAAASGQFDGFWFAGAAPSTALEIDLVGSSAGAFLVAAVAWSGSAVVTTPTGWLPVASDLDLAGISLAIFAKAKAVANDVVTFPVAPEVPVIIGMVAQYSGANSVYSESDPFGAGNNTAVIAPGFTTPGTASDANVLYIATWQDDVEPGSGPAALTQRGSTVTDPGSPGMTLYLADRPVPDPSTSVPEAVATLGSALPWIAAQIAVH